MCFIHFDSALVNSRLCSVAERRLAGLLHHENAYKRPTQAFIMSAAWLTYPLEFTGMRMSECGEKTPEQCAWYRQRWHFWWVVTSPPFAMRLLTRIVQVHRRLRIRAANCGLLHVRDRHLHHRPLRFLTGHGTWQSPRPCPLVEMQGLAWQSSWLGTVQDCWAASTG